MSQGKIIGASLLSGAMIALLVTVVGVNLDDHSLSNVLLWQYFLLVRILGPGPLLYVDDQGQPHYEGTPVLLLIWPVGFLLAIPIYSLASYFFLRLLFRRRRRETQRAP